MGTCVDHLLLSADSQAAAREMLARLQKLLGKVRAWWAWKIALESHAESMWIIVCFMKIDIPWGIQYYSYHYHIIISSSQVIINKHIYIYIITIPGLYKAICLLHWLKCRFLGGWIAINNLLVIFLTISIIPWLFHDYPILSHSIPSKNHILFP